MFLRSVYRQINVHTAFVSSAVTRLQNVLEGSDLIRQGYAVWVVRGTAGAVLNNHSATRMGGSYRCLDQEHTI